MDYLLLQGPDESTLHSAFMAIFESGVEEQVLILLAQRFVKYSSGAKNVYFRHEEPADDALYQILHSHGDKPTLLQTLLDNGCRIDSRFSWKFNDSVGAEDTSALLWSLCQGRQSIDSLTVHILFRTRRYALYHPGPPRLVSLSIANIALTIADPNFRTHRSGITPLMMAASSQNSNVTSRLLEADAYPNTQDSGGRTHLQIRYDGE